MFDKFKEDVARVLSTWVAVGVGLIALGASGLINIPVSWIELFSQETADAISGTINLILEAIGGVVGLWQLIRAIFVAEKINNPDEEVLAKSVVNKGWRKLI